MSLKKLIPAIALGLVFGASLIYLFPLNDKSHEKVATRSVLSNRGPASEALLGKHHRIYEVQISAVNGLPATDEHDLILKADVELLQPTTGDTHFHWVLPDGASLVSGEIEDSVSGLKAGQRFSREITIQGVSRESENRIVTLQVWTDVNNVKIGASGVFATRPHEIQLMKSQVQLKTLGSEKKSLPPFIQQ